MQRKREVKDQIIGSRGQRWDSRTTDAVSCRIGREIKIAADAIRNCEAVTAGDGTGDALADTYEGRHRGRSAPS